MPTLAQKRRLDSTLGGPLCALLNVAARVLGVVLHRDHSLREAPRRVLVIKLLGLGSIIHATPLLRAIKEKHPACVLSFLCFREVEGLVRRLPEVDEVLALDDRTYWRLLVTVLGFLAHTWRRRPDLVIDLEVYSKFSTILSTLTAARDRAGYYFITTRFRRGIYTHLVYYNRLRHVQEAYRQLGRALGLEPAVGRPPAPRVEREEAEAADRWLAQWQRGGRKLLLVNVNAGDLCLERRWEPEKFASVMACFAARDEVLVVMTGSPEEAEYTESVRRLVPPAEGERIVNAAGKLSFGEYLALLERADLLLTNDTGPLHLAAAFDTPTVSLWGPGLPESYRPLGDQHRVLCEAVYCSPCIYWVEEPPCAGDNVCMKRLGWRRVAAEVAGALGVELGPLEAPPEAPPTPAAPDGYLVRRSVQARGEPGTEAR